MDTIKSEANKAKPTPSATKPESIKVEPWADLPRQPYSLFTDDFVHEDIGVLKVNAKSSRGAVNIKQKLSCESGKYSVADDVKIWFGLKGQRTLYTRTKGKALKVHFDNGIT